MSNHHLPAGAVPDAPEAWQATRAQTALATQFMRDPDAYLSDEKKDIGRQVGANERELFVSCAPPEALQQQFDHVQPRVHRGARHRHDHVAPLLAGIAAASNRAVQKLFIRRQGYGTALATLEFIELPTADGSTLRMFSPRPMPTRHRGQGLARMLLAYSRLGVVMVGELPQPCTGSRLQAAARRDPRRHLAQPPPAAAAAGRSAAPWPRSPPSWARGTGVDVRTTPQVTRPADAWGFINGTWARIREHLPPSRAHPARRTAWRKLPKPDQGARRHRRARRPLHWPCGPCRPCRPHGPAHPTRPCRRGCSTATCTS